MTILIIAPSYAPYFHPRAHRWTAIAERWAEQGHRVLVVTSCVAGEPVRENRKGVEVYRVGYDSLRSWLSSRLPGMPERGRVGKGAAPSAFNKLAVWLYQKVWKNVCYPDDAMFWRQPALKMARLLMEQHNIQAAVSVSLPITSHRIGRALYEGYGIPWLADVGDPYASDGWEVANPVLYGRRMRKLERQLMQAANAVVVTGPQLKSRMNASFPLKNIYIVPPLLHPVPAAGEKSTSGGALRFGYFGAFYPPMREPFYMIQWLEKLRGQLDFRLHIYGDILPAYLDHFKKFDWIALHGLSPRAEAQKAMREMDVLINLGNANPQLLPSKSVDYLAADRPVLHLRQVPDDAFEQFVRPRGRMMAIDPEKQVDVFAIKNWINEQRTDKKNAFNPDVYRAESISEQYLQILYSISEGST